MAITSILRYLFLHSPPIRSLLCTYQQDILRASTHITNNHADNHNHSNKNDNAIGGVDSMMAFSNERFILGLESLSLSLSSKCFVILNWRRHSNRPGAPSLLLFASSPCNGLWKKYSGGNSSTSNDSRNIYIRKRRVRRKKDNENQVALRLLYLTFSI